MSGLKVSSSLKELLKEQEKIFNQQTKLQCKWSAELEFYLQSKDPASTLDIEGLSKALGLKLEKEKGDSQYEVQLPIIDSAIECAEQIIKYKDTLLQIGKKHNVEVILAAKPKEEQPGSGMHINISLEDQRGNNVFARDSDNETLIMHHAVAGLLNTMIYSMPIFAPTEESYKRFVIKTEAPTHVAWGGNNRTVAVRIPTSTHNEKARHIEHRVAGIDANPEAVLLAILKGIHYGIAYKLKPSHPKIYGNAYDTQYQMAPYNLQPLPTPDKNNTKEVE